MIGAYNKEDLALLTASQQEAYHNGLKRLKLLNAREKLGNFIEYNMEEYDGQWFHDIICDHIDKLSKREIKKLMIFMPPQHGKSTMSSEYFPAMLLGKNPKEKIILGSYNLKKASDFVNKSKRIVKSEKYKELYPNTRVLGKDTDSYFEVNDGIGFLKGAGMDSGVTGSPATCLIIDDPFKGRNDANSKTKRDRVWNTYEDDFQTRKSNDSIELMLFTRWHEDDMAGRLLNKNNPYYDEEEASEWTILVFQALKEDKKPIERAYDYDDPRELDEALWESRHSKTKYVKRRRKNPTGFASLDQQRPSPEAGNKIKKAWLQVINENELPFNINNVVPDLWIDGAFTKDTRNDETGLMSSYYDKKNDNLYIFNASGVRKEMYELLIYFKEYARNNKAKKASNVFIELKASGHPLKSMLRRKEQGGFKTRAIPNEVVGYGKFNRVENSESTLASGKVYLVRGHWNSEFIEQCASFPNGLHDDMLDLLCYAVDRYFVSNVGGGVKYED